MTITEKTNNIRILSVAPSCRGFGYAVLEGQTSLVRFAAKRVTVAKRYKNACCAALVNRLILRYRPDAFVLPDMKAKGIKRHVRIKDLTRDLAALAKRSNLNTAKISLVEVRKALLGSPSGTKYDIAVMMAKQFPDELAVRLPPKRQCGHAEDHRMDIFEAAALAFVAAKKGGARKSAKD